MTYKLIRDSKKENKSLSYLLARLAPSSVLWPFFRIISALLLGIGAPSADQIAVRHVEGLTHGFLVLRTLAGASLADGDLIQVARGDRVTHRLLFHFKDGSLHDETAVFSQRGAFRLLSDHLVQKGPSFPHPMDVSIECSTGQVTVRYEDDGKEKVAAERLELPPDLANGMVLPLLKNIRPDAPGATLSMVAATPKPRLVKLAITSQGTEPFSLGGSRRRAIHYAVKVEIGGLSGLLAPLLGKQPPDTHVWVLGGEAPAFVKSEGPFYLGGPIWRIELVSPVWSRWQHILPPELMHPASIEVGARSARTGLHRDYVAKGAGVACKDGA